MTQSPLLLLMFEASVRVVVLALLVGTLLAALRVRSSSVRHAAWSAVLCVMLLMPVLPSLVPAIRVEMPSPIADSSWPAFSERQAPVQPQGAATSQETANAISSAPSPTSILAVSPAGPLWPRVLLDFYLIGLAALLVRLMVGAINLARLKRIAEPLTLHSTQVPVCASSRVTVPITIGVLSPLIILPSEWSSWPPHKLAGVLAHEQAHRSRRDPLILFLAYVNCCLFWFHPLAWWLKRKLAATAEHACDEAGVQAMGEGRRYAEMLLEMAEVVRVRRGRVVWAGVGIDGAGLLQQRIDRILRGDFFRQMSRTRKVTVAFGCAAAIVIAVACREQIVAAPLKEDPEVAENLARQNSRSAAFKEATGLTREDVAALELKLKADPENLAPRKKLITFYEWSGQKVLGWNEMVAARRPHLLWMIEHHPEDEFATARRLMPAYDPIGYAAAKQLWTVQVERPDAGIDALSNAAYFFQVSDKSTAEQILLRLKAMDPKGPMPRIRDGVYFSPWADRLGTLYALAILGSNDDTIFNVVKAVSLAEAHGPFAAHARELLEHSQDGALLLAAGRYLTFNASDAKVDFDYEALGRTYVERAATVDPAGRAPSVLAMLRAREQHQARTIALLDRAANLGGGELLRKRRAKERWTQDEWKQVKTLELQAVMAMNETDRVAYLPLLADESTAAAEELVRLAPKFPSDPHYGDAIFQGNLTLGRHALKQGDVKGAVRFMKAAGKAPALSEGLRQLMLGPDNLANSLLQAGERESVATFLDQSATLLPLRRDQLSKAAASIRAGTMPMSYQYMVTPH